MNNITNRFKINPDYGKISIWLLFILFSLLLSIGFMYFTMFVEKRILAKGTKLHRLFITKYGFMIVATVLLIGYMVGSKGIRAAEQVKSEYNFSEGYVAVENGLMSGVIFDEGEFSWCEKECEVILAISDNCTILRIEVGTVATEKLISVDVFIEDVLVGSFELENERKSHEFTLPENLSGKARIRFVCSDTFIPAEEGINDTRELGMQLYYIGVR